MAQSSTNKRDTPLNPNYVDGYRSISINCPVCGYHLGDVMKNDQCTVYAPSNYCEFCGQRVNNNVLNYLSERKMKNGKEK